MSAPHEFFRLNVGFIIHQTVGYSRDFPFELLKVHLHPDLDLTNLIGVARVTRTAQGLILQVRLKAESPSECVRCLETFSQPLVSEFAELFAFSKNSVSELGLLVPETGKIDLEPLIREELLIAFPIKPLCRPDCKGLCLVCGENLNVIDCGHQTERVDPRLSALSKFFTSEEEPPPD